jgi:hypothetical protein
MHERERQLLRKFEAEVHAETDKARVAIPAPHDVETLPHVFGLNATVEEIGKLARAYNKLVIAREPDVVRQWQQEVLWRIRTSISLLERLYIKMLDESHARVVPPEDNHGT